MYYMHISVYFSFLTSTNYFVFEKRFLCYELELIKLTRGTENRRRLLFVHINACRLCTRRNVVPANRSRSKMYGRLSSSVALCLHSVYHVICVRWKLIFIFYIVCTYSTPKTGKRPISSVVYDRRQPVGLFQHTML